MLALVLAPLLVASQAFADADTDADPTQTTPTGTTAESGATSDDDKGGCGDGRHDDLLQLHRARRLSDSQQPEAEEHRWSGAP